MRQERTVQASIFDLFAEHEIGRELQAISHWLNAHCDVLGQVAEDLRRRDLKKPARQVCRPKQCCAARCLSNTAS